MDQEAPAQTISRKRRQHIIVSSVIVVAAAAFIGILSFGLTLDQSKVPPANIGKAANPFTVTWVQGHEILPQAPESGFTLADLKGHPLILNFWASWCVSCREEAHEFEKFWEAHRDKKDVLVVGIAIQDEKASAKKFADFFGKTYMIGLDADGKAAIDYGVSGVPETFMIDKQGVIRHKEIGPINYSILEEYLPQIL